MAPEPRQSRINRRQTGFVRPSNWGKYRLPDITTSEDDFYPSTANARKVRMDPSLMCSTPTPAVERRPTAFVRLGAVDSDSDINIADAHQPSVLTRLLDEQRQCSSPTLRDYRPSTGLPQQSMLLKNSNMLMSSDDGFEHYRDHTTKEDALTSNKKSQNITMSPIRFPLKKHKKARPSITVEEYQARKQ